MTPRPEGLSIDEVRVVDPSRRHRRSSLASAEQALHVDEPTDMEARYRRTDGSWRYVLTRRVVERDAKRRADRLRRRRARHDRAGRAPAPRRGAGAPARCRIARRRHRHLDDDRRARRRRLERADVRALRPLRAAAAADLRTMAARVGPSRRPRARRQRGARLLHAAATGRSRSSSATLRRDGSVRWIVMRADVDRATPGPRRVLGVAMDVTEQHRALDALREASERAALITRHAGIGTWEADRRRRRALGRADVPPARPRAARAGAEPRGAAGAGPSRRRVRRPRLDRRLAPRRSCRRPTSSASACPTAASAGSPRARPPCSTTPAGRCAASASTGTSPRARTPSSRASRRRWPSARARPSRSSSRA